MEEQKKDTTVNGLFEKAGDYLETRLDLVKLKTTRTTSDVVATGKGLGETSYGFFIVGGFYALVGIIFHLLREKWVKDPISNIIIKKMTKL
ncbi:MAG: hypothetical protein EOO06_18525 [Chitinophagaceae bacterium]|nr:MAG: hypothetical protein EOO06_18525 [Chitinophagaceae bacterium]